MHTFSGFLTKYVVAILLLLFMPFMQSCQVEGCTDPDSVNYDEDATEDDNSCMYEGSVVFWYGQPPSGGIFDNGTNTLKYYVDGELIGSTAADVYWTESPDCGANGSMSVTKDLGSVKNKTYEYEVVDDNGEVIWEGSANFTANNCESIQLKW